MSTLVLAAHSQITGMVTRAYLTEARPNLAQALVGLIGRHAAEITQPET